MKITIQLVRVFEFREGNKKVVLSLMAQGENILNQHHQIMIEWDGPLPEKGKIWELEMEN